MDLVVVSEHPPKNKISCFYYKDKHRCGGFWADPVLQNLVRVVNQYAQITENSWFYITGTNQLLRRSITDKGAAQKHTHMSSYGKSWFFGTSSD